MILDLDQLSPNRVYYSMIQTLVPRPVAWVLSDIIAADLPPVGPMPIVLASGSAGATTRTPDIIPGEGRTKVIVHAQVEVAHDDGRGL